MTEPRSDVTTLVIDIGNTNVVCGIYQEGNLVWHGRFFSSPNRTADEYYALIRSLLIDFPLSSIKLTALASVVPELSRVWLHLIDRYIGCPVLEINGLSNLSLTFKNCDPSTIGADLIANAFSAWKNYAENCIIIDLGTATTIQFVSAKGVFHGCSIAPGVKSGAEQLFKDAALITPIEIEEPEILLGTNSRDALLSGIVQGHSFMLEGFVKRIKQRYFDHKNIITILTGGVSDLIKPLVPSVDFVDKTLTIDGIYLASRVLSAQ